jgi:hypothetical protein
MPTAADLAETKTQHTPLRTMRLMRQGEGLVRHPVSGRTLTTERIELEGFGVIGEWLDYGAFEVGDKMVNLIAAAPDLLAACEALVAADSCNYERDTMRHEHLFDKARAALAKANGLDA